MAVDGHRGERGRRFLLALLLLVLTPAGPTASAAEQRGSPVVNSRIAFAMGSDLYTIRPNGKGLRRVTSGAGADADPAWSPNGRWLAFDRTSGRPTLTNVYVIAEAGGRPRLLARRALLPSWSPSGRRLAVLRESGAWTVPFPAGKPRLALAGASLADWSPSGRELAVVRSDGIWIVNVGSEAARQLSGISDVAGLDWSPDGSRLLLTDGNELLTMSTLDGSKTTLVSYPPPRPEAPPGCGSETIQNPTWSPDGRWIAYQEIFCDHSAVVIADANGKWQDEIQNTYFMANPANDEVGIVNPAWSPDSRALAFLDVELWTAGEVYLSSYSSAAKEYRPLKAGADWSGAPAWQRQP